MLTPSHSHPLLTPLSHSHPPTSAERREKSAAKKEASAAATAEKRAASMASLKEKGVTHEVSFKVALTDMDIADFDDAKQEQFKGDVATKLEVDKGAVDVTASAGSVNVDVKVAVEDPDAASAVAKSAKAAKSDLVDESVFGPSKVSGVKAKSVDPAVEREKEEKRAAAKLKADAKAKEKAEKNAPSAFAAGAGGAGKAAAKAAKKVPMLLNPYLIPT